MTLVVVTLSEVPRVVPANHQSTIAPIPFVTAPGVATAGVSRSRVRIFFVGPRMGSVFDFIILGFRIPCSDRDINNKVHGPKE